MASRAVFRRVLQVNRRLNLQRVVTQRTLVTLPHLHKKHVVPGQSYSQLKRLCTKAGDGMVINIQGEEDFTERVINNPLPVVVDFHARLSIILNM